MNMTPQPSTADEKTPLGLGTNTVHTELRTVKTDFDLAWQRFVGVHYLGTDPVGQVTRYILEAPGKRVRAMLCLLTARAVGNDWQHIAMHGAFAVEMVHAYSLVHDDLPCMDDDNMRRGRQTAHKVFDEARALLAGDGLLADAFLLLTETQDGAIASRLVHELAGACGTRGMVWGQTLDLHWTGRSGATVSDLIDIHSTKTAWLLGASCAMGAIAAGAPEASVEQWRRFGRYLGLAFQVVDDLLDDSPQTGKTAGKDKQTGKLTFPLLLGEKPSRQMADELTAAAQAILTQQTGNTAALREYTHKLLQRLQ